MSRLAVLALLTGAAVALTTSSAGSEAAASKRAGLIAFIRLTPGPLGGRLFDIRPDGSGLRPLTPPGTKVSSYAWSPDGTLIAYIDEQLSLWLVRPDGTGRRQLRPASRLRTLELSWSPDGREIAIVVAGPNSNGVGPDGDEIYLVPVGGGEARIVPSVEPGSVEWSPRGDEIAYCATGPLRGGLWAVHPDGSDPRLITKQTGGGGHWSADGGQLAFGVVIHLRSGVTDRYRAFAVVDADGRNFHVVTTHAYDEYGVAWSPSGRRILYGRADGEGIYVIGSDGRNNLRVTRDSPPGAGWGALAWAPDGRSIVYTSGGTGNAGNTDLYVIGIDGGGKFRLTSTPDIDIDPSWVAP